MLLEVEQDRGGLEDDKVAARVIDEHWDAPVRVQLDEPGLFLDIFGDVDLLHAMASDQRELERKVSKYLLVFRPAIRELQFLEEDGDFVAVGSAPGVECEVLGHGGKFK